jgi:transmembrane sensor
MNLPPPRHLAPFVDPGVDDKRIDRAWGAIASRPVRTGSPWRIARLAGALALVAVVVAIVVVVRGRPAPSSLAGVVFESGATQVVTLADGTTASLGSGARLRFDSVQADRVEAAVERGEVRFDVRHQDARAFVVHAAGVDVVDRGTRFVVDVEGNGVRVAVESGRVDIARAGASQPVTVLGAGESWTSGSRESPTASNEPASAPAVPTEAPTTTQAAGNAGVGSPSTTGASSTPGPRELLQAGKTARLNGHPREAAAAFDTLRRRFPDDPRAGLAAFELGRLRLDALGDPAGAAEALSDSIALSPGASFREDAEARLVEAFDRTHDAGRCAAARKAYLARHPNGVHAADVASRCP